MTEVEQDEAVVIMKEKNRSFGGKTEGFKDKAEQAFEQKHLKAYLKGNERFRHGYMTDSLGNRFPKYHEVKEVWS